MYLLIGIAGYISIPIETPELIIDRKSIFKSDYLMFIGKIFFTVMLFFSFTVNYVCARINIVNLLFKCENGSDQNANFTDKHNYIITAIILVLVTISACVYSDVTDYMKILGGFLTVIITNILPTLLYVKTSKHSKTHWKTIVPVVMTAITTIIGWTAGVITIINIFKYDD